MFFEKLAENPELQLGAVVCIVAICMAIGAFITYVFGVLPLREQKNMRGSTRKICDDGTPIEYYTNIIRDLQNEIEFWQDNCKTAEDRYNKLYQEICFGGRDQPFKVHKRSD